MVAQTDSHINIDFSGNLKTSINSNGIRILNPIRKATRINTIKIINSELFGEIVQNVPDEMHIRLSRSRAQQPWPYPEQQFLLPWGKFIRNRLCFLAPPRH